MIFVFGSNLAGIHGAGAAKFARFNHGAKLGVGVGRTGDSYAIPTKNHRIKTLYLGTITNFVNDFIQYAKDHTELQFKVTRIGCGLAGYTDEQIAPMFKGAPSNCFFDLEWFPILGNTHNYWN